ncbi:MAG TPA: hypothetical protein VGK65_11995 [Candidatus Binatia bacterium]
MTGKFTGRSNGFGFIEMSSSREAQSAFQARTGRILKSARKEYVV